MGQSSSNAEPTDVLILGASARAAAMSAARAGFRVYALDLFGDADLIETAHQTGRMKQYWDAFPILALWPQMPFIVTGALENHPRLIERLSKDRPFLGRPGGRHPAGSESASAFGSAPAGGPALAQDLAPKVSAACGWPVDAQAEAQRGRARDFRLGHSCRPIAGDIFHAP